jgi:hypothetical protein
MVLHLGEHKRQKAQARNRRVEIDLLPAVNKESIGDTCQPMLSPKETWGFYSGSLYIYIYYSLHSIFM